MVTPLSPSRMFNGLDEDIYNDAKFAHEINDKMRVPKRIKATGEYSDEDMLHSNQNGMLNSWNKMDNFKMNVPDRILVLGSEEHMGTRSAPLEIQLENSIFNKPKNSGLVRVNTPPRIITLNDHHFPSFSDGDEHDDDDDSYKDFHRPSNLDVLSTESDSQQTSEVVSVAKRAQPNNRPQPNGNLDLSLLSQRDGTPTGEISAQQETLYFRRQIAKLNRRILDIEISNEQRALRDRIVYGFGVLYFAIKIVFWLNRN